MKLKFQYVINEVAGQKVAVPINCGQGKQNIIKTNETGAFILTLLKNDIQKSEILEKITSEFEVESETQLLKWIDTFIEKLKAADVLCDE